MRSCLSSVWSLTTPVVGIHRYFHTTTIARRVGRGSFFAHLSLPKSPELDTAAVQRAYHDLQRRVHPDQANVQAKASEEEEQEQEQKSTFPTSSSSSSSSSSSTTNMNSTTNNNNTTTSTSSTNKAVADVDESMYANLAYETLRDPFLRCKYLARLSRAEEAKGGPLSPAEEEALMADDDRRSVEENRKITDESLTLSQEFLMEMMAVNESIFTVDPTEETGRDTLKLLIAHLGERYEEYYGQAREFWKTVDYQNFRRCVLEWTYIRNALLHAKNRLD